MKWKRSDLILGILIVVGTVALHLYRRFAMHG